MKRYIWLLLFLFLILSALNAKLASGDYRFVTILNNLNLENEFNFDFLLNFQADEIKILLNACFARHGRPFASRRTRDIFQNTIWYKTNPYYSDKMLTQSDKNNILKLRSMLVLSNENKTWLYQVKRVSAYKSATDSPQAINIEIDKTKDCLIIKGTVSITGTPWDISIYESNLPAEYEIYKELPFNQYGPDSWFIYDNAFYFFIEESVEVGRFDTMKIRKYFSCNIDYKSKKISGITLWSATTGDF